MCCCSSSISGCTKIISMCQQREMHAKCESISSGKEMAKKPEEAKAATMTAEIQLRNVFQSVQGETRCDATPVKICKAAALIAPHEEASSTREREREWEDDRLETQWQADGGKVQARADAAQQDVNKNHRLAQRGNEAGNELQQEKKKWKNQAMENYQLTQQICH